MLTDSIELDQEEVSKALGFAFPIYLPTDTHRRISHSCHRAEMNGFPPAQALSTGSRTGKTSQAGRNSSTLNWKLIYGVARKAGLTDVEAQDVVQETMASVAKHMPTFKYDPVIGSFKA